MKCPRCETENGTRSVCTKCGMFLYDGRSRNRKKMTQRDMAKLDARKVWRTSKQILKFLWMIIVLIVMSFLIILALQFFA